MHREHPGSGEQLIQQRSEVAQQPPAPAFRNDA
jgi:hypothetical protein